MLAYPGGLASGEAGLGTAKSWDGGEVEGWKGDHFLSHNLGDDELLRRITFAGQIPTPSANAQTSLCLQCMSCKRVGLTQYRLSVSRSCSAQGEKEQPYVDIC